MKVLASPDFHRDRLLPVFQRGVAGTARSLARPEQLVSVDESRVEVNDRGQIVYHSPGPGPRFETFVDCGQPHSPLSSSLSCVVVEQGVVRQARLTFRDGARARGVEEVEQDADGVFHLRVPGIAINDAFQPLDWEREPHGGFSSWPFPTLADTIRIIRGYFCEEASRRIVGGIATGGVESVPTVVGCSGPARRVSPTLA